MNGLNTIPYYGTFIVLSLFVSLTYIFLSLKKEKIDNKNIYLYIIMYLSFAIVFGKLFTIFTSSENLNLLNAGLSSYGGFIGVILSAYIFENILNTNNRIIKYTIISLPLTYAIGKIGCFIVGCCYGIPYNGIFSVIYKNGLNIRLFPVQLLETIVFIIIFIICNRLKNNKNIILITIILSSIMKFLLDYLRYDHINKFITVNQIFSIILVIVLVIYYIIRQFFYKE